MPQTFRPGLEHVAAYRAGKPAPMGPEGVSFKLSSNESPYAPLPSVVERLHETLPNSISRYPNTAAPQLVTALAARMHVPEDHIALGAGSVEVASQLIHALTAPGDEVLFAWRSFEAYPILVRAAGAVPVEVPLDARARHDLPAMAERVSDRTRVIFVCNPNNPTGTVVSAQEFASFMALVPQHVLVVLDEAYVHFDRDPASPDGLEEFRRYPNVAVLRTFSKAYGLAGLRIGYAVAAPDVVDALKKVSIPFAVSQMAQEAAMASLAAEAELQERIDEIIVERERVTQALRASGLRAVDSQTNFVWLELGRDSARITARFEERGISVRCFPEEGVRITVGSTDENDAVLAAAMSLQVASVSS